MSLNTVIAFALLLKKITRKGSMGKNHFRNKMRRPKQTSTTTNTATTITRTNHETSCSSSSGDEFDDDDEDDVDNIHIIQYNDYSLMNSNNKKSNSSILTAPSIKSLKQQKHHSDMITMLSTSPSQRKSLIVLSSSQDYHEDIVVKHNSTPVKIFDDVDEAITTTEVIDSDEITIVPITVTDNEDTDSEEETFSSTELVMIRDFAYPVDSPLHYGKTLKPQYSSVSLSSPDFNGREARALFDFTPETEYELPLKTGQTIWVQYRQCPGWLIADVQDETGLIPESYVEFI